MKYIPISVQGFSVKNALFQDLERTLDDIRAAGFDAIEFFGPFQWDAKRIAAALKSSGLSCSGWHVETAALASGRLEATVEYNLTFGSKMLIMPRVPDEMLESFSVIAGPTADFFAAAVERLRPYGIRTGLHHHHREFNKLPDAGMTILEAVTQTTPADFIIQLDTGNTMEAGADPLTELKKLPGRVLSLHVKPYSRATGTTAIIGGDDVDLDSILPFARAECGTQAIVVEFEGQGDEIACVRSCYDGLVRRYGDLLVQ